MIFICEECGRKYRIDPHKIKGESAKFKCKACGQVITVSKPREDERGPTPPPPIKSPASEPTEDKAPDHTPGKEERFEDKRSLEIPRKRSRRWGMRTKMFTLFFLIPIILIAAAGLFYLKQLDQLALTITGESSKVMTRLAEQLIRERARTVSTEVMGFLSSHREMNRDEFNSDEHEFRKVAVQKVGLTGYTALYELPGEDGIWRTWAHEDPNLIGIDMSTLKETMGKNFPGFWNIFVGVKGAKESKGFYTWQEKDGAFREKFMVCTPVEGTPFVIAATTYLDEFTRPIKDMESRANEITANTKNLVFVILGGTILLIGVTVFVYGYRLTGTMKALRDLSERISVGELDARLEISSRDEIGDLAEAISRMQESIRLSIERLRRRR